MANIIINQNNPVAFLHQFFPPLPRSTAMLEMCEHMNAVEELPTWKKRRKFLADIKNAWRVPTRLTGARIAAEENVAEHFRRTVDTFSNRLRLSIK